MRIDCVCCALSFCLATLPKVKAKRQHVLGLVEISKTTDKVSADGCISSDGGGSGGAGGSASPALPTPSPSPLDAASILACASCKFNAGVVDCEYCGEATIVEGGW